ncbi:membrane protein [Coxiella burnetii]|uniref:Hypothetical membrane associated protein n=1 Tax=Coxiella burnetii (strain RSA 493 / Nine Mile phase I) TaxID=227377 RepID=Q83DK8_COXBU|nr:membrane protein [Coxiella burnetii]NP_819746.1 membrane-associated protein [Coxiella burnetii RSA 493]AAO90260.1 hypothetical membrane associated protein [Coxiella burnetii RSA 493]ABX79022.1 hypothetical protein COXBURSA331_A0836 [Coxiella burnetii RSA 331]ACJ18604.1 hypothetical membrane-associated protein [Coxiella burnetii CbuG_Q212]AML49038.1 hypothetical protein AUR58_07510 [Coxiella burnetii]AML54979.1 hypothetical protein AYM38_06705 [Coxiella burnetii]
MPKETKTDSIKQEFATFSDDVAKLRGDLSSIIHKLTSFSKTEASMMKNNFVNRGKDVIHSVESKCKKKPLATLGYAFGAGIITGIISRKIARRK